MRIKLHDITGFKWRHPLPSIAVAWNCEYCGWWHRFLVCITLWRWSVVFSWPNAESEALT